MSGGSMNYFYSTLEEYSNALGDREMKDLAKDLAEVYHDKEWADSGDISQGEYNERLVRFKQKWFTKEGTVERRDKYIEETVADLKRMFGEGSYCKDCFHWKKESVSSYGQCENHKGWLDHGYESACKDFEQSH